jgi:hypothetical protein
MQLLLGGQEGQLDRLDSCFENYNTKVMPVMSPSVSSMPLRQGGCRWVRAGCCAVGSVGSAVMVPMEVVCLTESARGGAVFHPSRSPIGKAGGPAERVGVGGASRSLSLFLRFKSKHLSSP